MTGINYELIIMYFTFGALGATVSTLLIALNESGKSVKDQYKITSFKKLNSAIILIRELIVNSLVGGTMGIAANHAIWIAILVGFFSQSIGLTLVKWSRTKSFETAVQEIVGALFERVKLILQGENAISREDDFEDKI